MTKKSRIRIIACILCSIALLVGLFFAFIKINKENKYNAYAQLFSYDEAITMQTEQSLSSEYLNGKKGILFSTQKANKKISVTNEIAGDFEVEFTPVSSQKGSNDFSTVSFEFNSESERFGFVVSFNARENGVVGAISLTHIENVTCEFFVEGSFCNTSDKAIKFYFKPKTMTLYNADNQLVADFTSKEYMKNFGVVTTLNSFEKYTVDISFSNILSGKEAKLLIFELCGQKLDKATLENSSAPMIVEDKELSGGVVNKPYLIPTDITTYDILDGFRDSFVGDIRITDNQNMPIQVEDNQFIPTTSGLYYIHYTPKDSGGIHGKEYSCSMFVFEEQPDIEMHYQYPIDELVIGKNTNVSFGKITASTLLQTQPLSVRAGIKLGENLVYSIEDCTNGFSYTFDSVGEYTVVLQANDYIGYSKVEEYNVKVQDVPIFQNIQIKDNYAKDTAINLSSVYPLYGNDVYEADAVTVTITYPDKTKKTSKAVVLDQEGTYRVDFSAKVNGVDIAYVKYFTVKNDNVSLWEAQDGLTVTANAVAPDYADGNYVGTKLSVTRPVECLFKNVINISDNTKDDLLTEVLIAPSQAGTLETSCIDIILTDVYNSEKVVDIRLTSDIWGQIDKKDRTSIIAQPKRYFDDEYLRLINSNYGHYYYYATMLKASLYGRIDSGNGLSPAQPIKFYFDYQTGQLYADMAKKGVETGKLLVADLSDVKYVGEGNLWDKFTTGEVEFSIKISKLSKDANLMVLNIDGQNLAGEFTKDTTPPSIFVDYEGNSETAVPYGIVNKTYTIFDSYARDLVGGVLQNIAVNVYRKEGSALLEIPVEGKTFTPSRVGEYVIKYSVYDSAKNKAEKTVSVFVKEEKDIPNKSYEFSDKNICDIFVGEYFRFFEGVAAGGSGKLTTRMEILLDGKKIETDDDNGFVVEKAGNYTVSVVVSDYLGESEPFMYTLQAIYSPNAIMQEKTMPKAVILGEKFEIPQFEAYIYSEEGKTAITPKIYINGNEISGNTYTPTEVGTLDIDFVAQGTTYSYEVEVLTSQEKTETYTQRFFLTDAEISALTRSMVFTFDKGITINVVRKIDVDFLNFVISSEEAIVAGDQEENTIPAGTNLAKIDCTIVDSVDSSIKITFSLVKKDSQDSYLEYCGVRYSIKNATFDSYSKNFNVSFDATTNKLYVGQLAICELNQLDNGKTFKGFTSGEVYLSFAATPTTGKAAIGIVSIAGQSFNSTIKLDRVGPELQVLGDFSEVKIGDTLNIPAAEAFDFISGIRSVCVTVVSPSNEVLLNNVDITIDKTITISEFGKYKIQYRATDGRGVTKETNYTIGVLDTQPPEIILLGELPESIKVGKVVKIPAMEVVDNNSGVENIKTYIYVITPNGEMLGINNNQFTAERKGEYIVVYVAMDEDNTTATKRITILAR